MKPKGNKLKIYRTFNLGLDDFDYLKETMRPHNIDDNSEDLKVILKKHKRLTKILKEELGRRATGDGEGRP